VEAVKDFPGLHPETMKMILAVPNGVTFELEVEDDNGKMQTVKYRRESAGFRPVTVRK
jgi:hypothetical protein